MTTAINDYDKANAALVDERALVTCAQQALDGAKTDLTNKTNELHTATIEAGAAKKELQKSQAASTQADEDLTTAKNNLNNVKSRPGETAKQKAPSVGRVVGGVGNVVQGIGLIIYGTNLKKAGDVALGNLNIAQGSIWTTVGSGDAIDGTIKFFGDGLGKVKIPSSVGRLSTWEIWLLSSAPQPTSSELSVALVLRSQAWRFSWKRKRSRPSPRPIRPTTRLRTTASPAARTTPQDITGAGPLGDPTPLPGGIGGGSGPRPG